MLLIWLPYKKVGRDLNRTDYNWSERIWNVDSVNDSTIITFKAFVDAVIPRSQELADQFGRIQYYGALDLYTDEYMIISLNSLVTPLANPVAEILNLVAEQLAFQFNNRVRMININSSQNLMYFVEFLPMERLTEVQMLLLPEGIIYYPMLNGYSKEDMFSVIQSLNRITTMGYYSEWSGYGSTRLNPPDLRVLEMRPISWEQVGYPGPSFGYRAAVSDLYI